LLRFACRLTGSAHDAEDIVQECFLELLRPDCGYDSKRTPLRTYLFGVVRNQSLKRLRARSLTNNQAGPIDGISTHSPERQFQTGEISNAVARAVMQLPDNQREVLLLAHYEQMPLAEIADVLDIELGAVKSRLQRARAQLRETLAAFEPDEERTV